MLLNLLVVRAGVTEICNEIDFLCVPELLWARSCQVTGRRRLQTFASLFHEEKMSLTFRQIAYIPAKKAKKTRDNDISSTNSEEGKN